MGFNLSSNSKPLTGLLRCGECGRKYEPLPVSGKGGKGILVVFEQPTSYQKSYMSWTADDDITVYSKLKELGFDLEEDLWSTGVLVCSGRSGKEGSIKKYEHCLLNLSRTLAELKPQMIITVGAMATGAVLRRYNSSHYASNFSTSKLLSRCIPLNKTDDGLFGCWLVPVYSDEEIEEFKNDAMKQMARVWVKRSILRALNDFPPVPPQNPLPSFDMLLDRDEVGDALAEASKSRYVAFDYETNCFQPELSGSRILTAGVSYIGERGISTFAFPMTGVQVREHWRRFLASDVYKIGANIKFEHRWSMVHLKQPVSNWYWDVCIGGRLFDCYPGNAGLKFLTFVDFGIIGYDDEVEPYMTGGQGDFNSLDQVAPQVLLTYNAYDAYYTLRLFQNQTALFGFGGLD